MMEGIMTVPMPRRMNLQSYGGERATADSYAPADEAELQAVFALAVQQNKRVTLRGGGNAFDTQSLNDVIVVSMEKFKSLQFDPSSGLVEAGAATTWGEVVSVLLPQGFVPYVTVTSSTASIGGTVSSDCLSRFSPTLGREGNYVTELRVVPFQGAPFTCSATQRKDDFNAIVGGLGYLGAVTRVTHRVYRLPFAGKPVVRTDFHILHDMNRLDQALLERLTDAVASGEPVAVAATVYLGRWLKRGAVMTSRYVDSTTLPPNSPRSFLFRPDHPLHLATQTLFLIPGLRPLLWWVAFSTFLRQDNTSWDSVEGWTFFQNGNATVKRFGRKLGLLMGTRQQTFIVPFEVSEAGPGDDALSRFLRMADQKFDEVARQTPALIDILYLPKEQDEVPVLCATSGGGGFAVTFAFETSLQRRLRRVEDAMAQVSEHLWQEFGGRVHLVKHVFAAPALLEQMYDWQTFSARKATLDPGSQLKNSFLGRVFPQIGAPPP
jgi:decaprenylphospho-beta-D-ribofuranose 2-oxidase